MKLTYVALVHGITKRGVNDLELVGKIKKTGSSAKDDEKVLRAVCEYYKVDYDRLPAGGG